MKNIILTISILAVFSACKKNDTKQVDANSVHSVEGYLTDTISGDFQNYGVAEGTEFIMPAVGSKAIDFTLKDAYGNTHQLSQIYNEGPVALIFYRGQWCPYCNKHLSALMDGETLLKSKKITVVAITPEVNENIAKTKEKSKATMLILSDKNGQVMQDYGVAFNLTTSMKDRFKEAMDFDFTKEHTTGEAVLPVPATFVINTNGEIVFRHFNPKYSERASVNDIVNSL